MVGGASVAVTASTLLAQNNEKSGGWRAVCKQIISKLASSPHAAAGGYVFLITALRTLVRHSMHMTVKFDWAIGPGPGSSIPTHIR